MTIQSDETTPTAPDAAAHDEIDFTLAKQQENHRDAIALIREAHAIQVASLEEEIKRLTKELHDMGDNRDKWKAQCEANSEELTRLVAEAALQSRALQDWQPDVLHILNTLDAPAGEHHERFLAGWASAIGQMSARIQALPSIKETSPALKADSHSMETYPDGTVRQRWELEPGAGDLNQGEGPA